MGKNEYGAGERVESAERHWAMFERGKANRPLLRYVAMLDGATHTEHRKRHNLVLPVDHPYWDVWAPPCGRECRCSLQSLSSRDFDRLVSEGERLFTEPPDNIVRPYLDKVTGDVIMIAEGIEPGWQVNPGHVKPDREALSARGIKRRWTAV